MSRNALIPKVEYTGCRDCLAFHKEASEKLNERDCALEQAFDSHEIAQVEQEFDATYMALFRAWMDHKSTHETGSLRRYVAKFREDRA